MKRSSTRIDWQASFPACCAVPSHLHRFMGTTPEGSDRQEDSAPCPPCSHVSEAGVPCEDPATAHSPDRAKRPLCAYHYRCEMRLLRQIAAGMRGGDYDSEEATTP